MTRRSRGRHARRAQGSPVSLFSFLAVLICTMGALLLLLAVITHEARVEASQESDTTLAELKNDLVIQGRIAQFQREQLDQSRQAVLSQWEDARLKLGVVERHIAEMREKIRSLEKVLRQLESDASGDEQARRRTAQRIESLRKQLADAQAELDRTRREAAARKPSYQVVPYQGPNQTHRRPIYLECRANALVIQPEGIVIGGSDLITPLGPGKSLESALRAVREHWFEQSRALGKAMDAEPYPLLLVRPSGIDIYLAARAAMQDWRQDFGYELIEEDWQLSFPEPDDVLTEQVQRVVGEVRRREQVLAQLYMQRAAGRGASSYVLDSQGGWTTRGSGVGEELPTSRHASATGRASSEIPAHPPSISGTPGNGRLPSATEVASASTGQAAIRGPRDTSSSQDSSGNVLRNGSRRYDVGGPAWPRDGSGGANAEASHRGSSANAVNSGAHAAAPGEGAESAGPGGAACPTARRLADVRGRNWGLPGAVSGAMSVQRPLPVACYPDRLVLLEPGSEIRGEEILLGWSAEPSIDRFVSAVWSRMEKWGTAGSGMYWSPVLNVRVKPDAEARFYELTRLLDGSGLEIRRSEQP